MLCVRLWVCSDQYVRGHLSVPFPGWRKRHYKMGIQPSYIGFLIISNNCSILPSVFIRVLCILSTSRWGQDKIKLQTYCSGKIQPNYTNSNATTNKCWFFFNYVIILLMQMVSRIKIISTLRFVPKRQVIKVNMFCLLMCMLHLNLI